MPSFPSLAGDRSVQRGFHQFSSLFLEFVVLCNDEKRLERQLAFIASPAPKPRSPVIAFYTKMSGEQMTKCIMYKTKNNAAEDTPLGNRHWMTRTSETQDRALSAHSMARSPSLTLALSTQCCEGIGIGLPFTPSILKMVDILFCHAEKRGKSCCLKQKGAHNQTIGSLLDREHTSN